ncbi:MAG TPA: hypothetical protein VHX88_20625 [Solirubrobacteraceae bacterium]|jgi:hypothetical protein|nr:hypothetical protein [Solirubrobacteraceae bacterium]
MRGRSLLLLGTAALLAGCGGSSHHSTVVTTATGTPFGREANAICAAANTKINALPGTNADDPGGAQSVAIEREAQADSEAEVRALTGLAPPSALAGAWRRLLGTAAAVEQNNETVIADLKANNPSKASTDTNQTLGTALTDEASALGLSQCAAAPAPGTDDGSASSGQG